MDCGSPGVLEALVSICAHARMDQIRTNVVLAHNIEQQNSLQLLLQHSIGSALYSERELFWTAHNFA